MFALMYHFPRAGTRKCRRHPRHSSSSAEPESFDDRFHKTPGTDRSALGTASEVKRSERQLVREL